MPASFEKPQPGILRAPWWQMGLVLLPAAFAYGIMAWLVTQTGGDIAGAHLLSVRRQQVDSAMTRYIDSHGAESPVYLLDGSTNMAGIAERARQIANEAVRLGIYRPVRP